MGRRSLRILQVFLVLAVTSACDHSWHGKLGGDLLNPDRYRAQIAGIDRVLFQNGPLKWSDRQPLEQEMLILADAASADPNNTNALEASLDLRLLSTMAASGQISNPVVNSELTSQWRHVRRSLFGDAAWFRHSATDAASAGSPNQAQFRRPK